MRIATPAGDLDPLLEGRGSVIGPAEREQGSARHEVGRHVVGKLREELLELRPRIGVQQGALVLHGQAVARKRIRGRPRDEGLEGLDPIHTKSQ